MYLRCLQVVLRETGKIMCLIDMLQHPLQCYIRVQTVRLTRQASPSATQEMYLWECKWDTGTSCCVIKLLRASPNTLMDA